MSEANSVFKHFPPDAPRLRRLLSAAEDYLNDGDSITAVKLVQMICEEYEIAVQTRMDGDRLRLDVVLLDKSLLPR